MRDRATGQFLDADKQHVLDHDGEFFRVRGPLNLVRSPQGPGDLPGRRLRPGPRPRRQRRRGNLHVRPRHPQRPGVLRRPQDPRADRFGRNPRSRRDHARHPGRRRRHRRGGPGDRGAQPRAGPHVRRGPARVRPAVRVARFTQYDLDAPFPSETLRHGERSFYTRAKEITPAGPGERVDAPTGESRHPVSAARASSSARRRRSPTSWSSGGEARACDGFNIGIDHPANFRRVVDQVIPLLQERGVFREDYDSTLLRGHLGLPVPETRTAARAAASPGQLRTAPRARATGTTAAADQACGRQEAG